MNRKPAVWLVASAAALLAVDGLAQSSDDREPASGSDIATAGAEPTPAADPASSAGAELMELPESPVRAGDADDGEIERPEPARLPETRLEILLELNRLVDAERYDDVLTLADRLIELTEEEFGAESIEAAEAYERAAGAQRDAGEHELSEQSYLHAIELYRSADGPYTADAIEPLIGLGDNYSAAGQHLNAVTAYDEARTINRRVFGLLNEGQIPILDRLTETFQALDQYQEADEQQLTVLNLAERNYPEGSPEHLEAIYRYAAWLRESGRYHEERTHYARAMRLIRDMHGKESLLLVRPLREVANSFRTQRLPDNQGLSSLRSAVELLDAHPSGNDLARAEVLRDIGDWDVAFSNTEPDLEPYRRAWTLLGDVDDGEHLRREWFQELQSVIGEPISQRGLSLAPEAVPGYVIVRFDVDRFGRTGDLRIARSDPAGFKDEAVLQALRRWRFRPHIEDGAIVSRDDILLRFNYRYLPDANEPDEQAG